MTLAKQRNYELVLPTHYVDVDQDEMEYVDGGIYIDYDTLAGLLAGAITSGAIASVPMIIGSMDAIALTIAAAVPGLGWITGGILTAYSGAFAVQAAQAIVEHKGIHIRLSFPWGLSFSVG